MRKFAGVFILLTSLCVMAFGLNMVGFIPGRLGSTVVGSNSTQTATTRAAGSSAAPQSGVIATPPVQPPQSPATLVAVRFGSNDATLSWSQSARAQTYLLYRGTTPDFSQAQVIVEQSGTLYRDTGLNPLTTYYYWVGAKNESGTAPPLKRVSFETYDTWSDIERNDANSVVKIKVYTSALGVFGSEKEGTGWLAPGGYIVTNDHVIANWNWVIDIYVQNSGTPNFSGQKYHAKVVAVDEAHDLAILKVQNFPQDTPLPISATPAQVGDTIAVYGRPGGEQLTLATGQVVQTGDSAHVTGDGVDLSMTDLTLTDAPSVSGNSGSPVLNQYGQVVGIMESGSANTGNHNYFVPVKYLNQWGIHG